MRTYDPADRIHYVHLAGGLAAPAAPPRVPDECDRLPAGYANASLRHALGRRVRSGARPALVVLAGGSGACVAPAPALRLAR